MVFIYHGNDIVVEHHIHAVLLIEIVTACGEILFSGENLPARNAVAAETVIVTVDELGLPYGRDTCDARTRSQPLDASGSLRPAATAPDDTMTTRIPAEWRLGYPVDKRADMRVTSRCCQIAACEFITTDFYGNIF